MATITRRAGRHPMMTALAACAALALDARAAGPVSYFPTVDPAHTHARALLENAMLYVAAANRMVDPVSGYPFEGWNQDPSRGLFLRSFTQLTAIGQYMELLADIVAGEIYTPGLDRDRALAGLTKLAASLRRDQRDPTLGSKGLLVNFLDLATGKRLGPLASDVEKKTVLAAFGDDRGEAIWKALRAKGWIATRNDDREGAIQRDAKYGSEYFDGPLAPYRDAATRQKLMDILDQRVVLVVFGDNSNLSASAAKAIGALLSPAIADRPEVVKLRDDLEGFLDAQREGYAGLYDPKAGLFDFGWDATRGRLFGWEDLQGKWTTGHMDYFVNEFRGPSIFAAARFGLPTEAVADLGFKMKPYRAADGRDLYALAPWEGSAFQAMGLGLMIREPDSPSWRELLGNVVDVEIDYATRHHLPGFLSESYTGDGVRYTGTVGIPEITVSPRPRITDAASLYTLGVAYTIAPARVEAFLAANWPSIARLRTDHGPWEGFNISRNEPIPFQTSAHTLALVLGLIGTGPAHMRRYADHKGFAGRLGEFFRPGEAIDLLDGATRAFAWANKGGQIKTSREGGPLAVTGDGITMFGIAFVPGRPGGVDLSGDAMMLRYRSGQAIDPVLIQFKPIGDPAIVNNLITKEIFTRFEDTGGREREVRVPLPATVGLSKVKEIVVTHERAADARPIDLAITRFGFAPIAAGH